MKKRHIMKYVFFLLLIIFFYMIMQKQPPKTYKINVIEGTCTDLILLDDFNNSLNPKYWTAIERGNNYNSELQFYHSDNVYINEGLLKLEARREDYSNHKYTSGMITTQGKFEFLYGKIIFKAKPAAGNGLLSAIWLLPADDSLYPEVDMMEVLGNKNQNQMWTGLHYKGLLGEAKKYFINLPNNGNFALYEFEWNENEIKGYMDNKLIYHAKEGIPNKKMYLIISLAVGGNWPGTPDENILPAKLLVDYVVIIPRKIDSP